MRIAEMRAREPFDTVLADTLQQAAPLFGLERIEFSTTPLKGGQHWCEHPLLSVFTAGTPAAPARRFLKDSLRRTDRLWRRAPQWMIGTFAGSRLGLRIDGRDGFWVRPALGPAATLLIAPGNRRIRFFDFEHRQTTVITKAGFDERPMRREIRVREDRDGPFPPILHRDPAGRWLVEPLLEGWTLARLPYRIDRATVELRALELLDDWSAPTKRREPAGPYVESLTERIEEQATRLDPGLTEAAARVRLLSSRLASLVRPIETVVTALTHGDLQPGNVFVERAGAVTILDWEHSGRRLAAYDRACHRLRTRASRGLAARLAPVLDDRSLLTGASRRERTAEVAALLLEDLAWFTEEAASIPTLREPTGLRLFTGELAAAIPRLAREVAR